MNHRTDTPMGPSGTEVELKDIKLLMLEMLDEIDAFCAKEGIEYFLVGGSLLGAIRHNGFIPWDDDIDIGMRRADYERFVATFKSESGHTNVMDYRNTKHYPWSFAKAIHSRTTLIENGCERCPIGVFIDIFPIDVVQGSYEDTCKRIEKVHSYKDILNLKHVKLDKKRGFVKNTALLFSKVLNVIPDKSLMKAMNKTSGRDRDCSNYDYVCNFAGAWGKKEIVTPDCVDGVARHAFEDREYNILKNYDKYLTTIYGNYMTPPPPEKQVSHHTFVVYWK